LLGVLFVTPFVVAYALFVRWVDRFEPEPWGLLLFAFCYGALFATLGGGISSGIVQQLAANALSVPAESEKMQAFAATVLAPVFEELFKAGGLGILMALSASRLHEIDGPLDGVIYGGVIGLGFTLTEDILYVASMYAQAGAVGFAGLLVVRTIFLGLSHCTFTALTGLGVGLAAESNRRGTKLGAPVAGLAAAIVLHALHNGLPTFFGAGGAVLMIAGSWLVNMAFFALLGILVARDRAIVARELETEVGDLLHAQEHAMVLSYVTLNAKNLGVLASQGFARFRARRAKQLALMELAFVKWRRRRGPLPPVLEEKERRLRTEIAQANVQGVWLAP
jgi:RsiW-degrading membrane proteinase PrsW (M82 family)